MTFRNIILCLSIGMMSFGSISNANAINYMYAYTHGESPEQYIKSIEYSADTLHTDVIMQLTNGSDKLVIPEGYSTVKPRSYIPNGIKEVILPNSLKTIEENAFCGSPTLESITIQKNVSEIRYGAFQNCSELKTVHFSENSKLFVIEGSAFKFCEQLSSIVIPENVSFIGSSAFQSCVNLESVTFGNSVSEIGDSAFFACSKLKSVTLPSSVWWMGNSVFSNCTNLTEVVIENGLDAIPDHAFANCRNLESVVLHNSIKSIAKTAFIGCDKCRFTVYSPRVENLLIQNGITQDRIDLIAGIEDDVPEQPEVPTEPVEQNGNDNIEQVDIIPPAIQQKNVIDVKDDLVEPTDTIAPQLPEIDTTREISEPAVDVTQPDTEVKEKTKKKGFFSKIFGKHKSKEKNHEEATKHKKWRNPFKKTK